MAMHTGIGLSKILILAGAGYTGSILIKNGRLSEILGEIQSLVKGLEKSDSSNADPEYSDAIASQVRRLAMEVRQMASSHQITVLNGGSGQIGNMASLAMPAATLGALGYAYMWWKGLSFSDLMYVTKKNMANAVSSMTKHLEQVSAALSEQVVAIVRQAQVTVVQGIDPGMQIGPKLEATKKHLTQRIENLDGKLDEQKEMSKLIKNEVTDIRADLSQIGYDLDSLQRLVSGLDGTISSLEDKQDYANFGVWYLCNFIGAKDEKMAQFLKAYPKPSKPRFLGMTDTPSKKGLKQIADAMVPGSTENSMSNAIVQK